MAESGMVGADTSIYNKLMQPQPQNDLGHLVGIANAAQQNQLLQAQVPLQINNEQLANGQKHLDYVTSYLAPLLDKVNKNQPVTVEDVTRQANLAAAGSNGAMPQSEANQWVQKVITNPAGIPAALKQFQLTVLDHGARIAAIRGNTITNNDGKTTNYLQQDAFSGGLSPAPGGSFPNKLTPQDKIAGQSTFQNGQAGTRNVGATFDDTGNLRPVAPSPGQTPATSMAPAGMGTPPAPVVAAPAASAFNPTSAPLGVAEAATRTAAQSADQGGQLQALADGAPDRKAKLAQLEQLLGQTTTGPIAGPITTAGALANQMLETAGYPKIIPGVADKEEFQKIASQLQAAQAGALGGTDAAKALAGHTNPSLAFSTEGNKHIITMLKGQEDAISAKNAAWQEWKKTHGADTYGAFQDDFNKHFEPRAFMAPYMSKEERAKLVANMKPNEKAALNQATQTALDRGWINPPKD